VGRRPDGWGGGEAGGGGGGSGGEEREGKEQVVVVAGQVYVTCVRSDHNRQRNSAPPGTHVRARSSLSADIFISFMIFVCLFNQQVCPSQTRLVRFENTMQLNAHCTCACSLVFFLFFQ
jgi:hypothetical protein